MLYFTFTSMHITVHNSSKWLSKNQNYPNFNKKITSRFKSID